MSDVTCKDCSHEYPGHEFWCEAERLRRINEIAWLHGYTSGMQDGRGAMIDGFALNPYRDDPKSSLGQRMYKHVNRW